MILVDSSVWIRASRRGGSAEADELRALLERDQAATTELVIAEVLQGAKNQADFETLADRMKALHFFPAGRAEWEQGAQLSFQLRSKGLMTPLADLVIAAVALKHDLPVYAVDDHFGRVESLRLHIPGNYVVRRAQN